MTTDSTSTPPSADLEHGGVSRRSVVRTGANHAWAVPAISMVTAAPALAVSGTPRLRIASFSAKGITGGAVIAMGPVKNVGQADAGQLTAVVQLPSSLRKAKVVGSSVSAGWQVADGRGPSLTFVTSTSSLPPGGKSKPLDFKVKQKGLTHRPKGRVTVAVRGEQGSHASASDSL